MSDKPVDAEYQKQTAEVERLLRELRPESPSFVKVPTGPPGAAPGRAPPLPHRSLATPLRDTRPTTGSRPAIRPLPSPLGVWARVVLGLLLAGAMLAWPYRSCGLLLVPYFGASAMVLVAGAWAGEASWRRRMGLAHTLAIMILLGGAAVAARPLLPHMYAAGEADWQCTPGETVQWSDTPAGRGW